MVEVEDRSGALTIHSIGIIACRGAGPSKGEQAGRIDPADPAATQPRLIEKLDAAPAAVTPAAHASGRFSASAWVRPAT